MQVASHRPAHHLVQGQAPARGQNAMHLTQHRLLVIDARPDRLRPDHIELAITQRHLPPVATDNPHALTQTASAAQLPLVRKSWASDRAPSHERPDGQKRSRRTADPRSDVDTRLLREAGQSPWSTSPRGPVHETRRPGRSFGSRGSTSRPAARSASSTTPVNSGALS